MTDAVRAVLQTQTKEKAKALGESALQQPDGVRLAAEKVEEHLKELFLRKKEAASKMKPEL